MISFLKFEKTLRLLLQYHFIQLFYTGFLPCLCASFLLSLPSGRFAKRWVLSTFANHSGLTICPPIVFEICSWDDYFFTSSVLSLKRFTCPAPRKRVATCLVPNRGDLSDPNNCRSILLITPRMNCDHFSRADNHRKTFNMDPDFEVQPVIFGLPSYNFCRMHLIITKTHLMLLDIFRSSFAWRSPDETDDAQVFLDPRTVDIKILGNESSLIGFMGSGRNHFL